MELVKQPRQTLMPGPIGLIHYSEDRCRVDFNVKGKCLYFFLLPI